jgi:hypothetical protein
MAGAKRRNGLELLNSQIEAAQEVVIKRKHLYDEATDNLKVLLDKRKALQTDELIKAFTKSKRSYEDIIGYINSVLTKCEQKSLEAPAVDASRYLGLKFLEVNI